MAAVFTLSADNFNQAFNAWLIDGNMQVADSILRVWSRELPDDPELYPARFNLLLNKARSEMMVLSTDPGNKDDELVLTDSCSNVAGYMYSDVLWQDSLADAAFAEIDRGIAACPDRIDFRLGKAAAGSMTGRWPRTIDAVEGILDRDNLNQGRWYTTGNAEVAYADTLLADAMYDRFAEIHASELKEVIESALPVVTRAALRFAGDTRIVNIAGAMNYGVGNKDAAIDYFEKAARIDPNDAIPLTNIACIQYESGDTAKALEIFRQIENGNYDDQSRSFASQMIANINTPVTIMQDYYYFFRYLPEIAVGIGRVADFLDVELINSRVPAYNKFVSPFADTDITAEDIQPAGVSQTVVVWTFPMPEKIPLCRYVAFVADGQGGCRIYTLEKSIEDYWVVGTQQGTGHSNFGDVPYPDDAAGFVKVLVDKGLLKATSD
ncbi:MAG: tetratricopeptide repeat protein [Muribaculaceae bacterium]|nr:tetratricopeptide repeat protein [Muribaculaceae bacterium]